MCATARCSLNVACHAQYVQFLLKATPSAGTAQTEKANIIRRNELQLSFTYSKWLNHRIVLCQGRGLQWESRPRSHLKMLNEHFNRYRKRKHRQTHKKMAAAVGEQHHTTGSVCTNIGRDETACHKCVHACDRLLEIQDPAQTFQPSKYLIV